MYHQEVISSMPYSGKAVDHPNYPAKWGLSGGKKELTSFSDTCQNYESFASSATNLQEG
jgi:hypothetical protein